MKTVTVLFLSVLFAGLAFGDVINVPGGQATIQAGIDAALNGDTVLVAENTYYENINFKGKAITVASMFLMDQDTAHISKTIIDGSQPSNPDSGSVVIFDSGEDTTSVLCGFKITGGTGTQVLSDLRVGGAILCANFSGAKLIWNIIKNNSVVTNDEVQGGAISSGPPGSSANVIIVSNEIKNNTASGKNGAWGGAINLNSNGYIKNNVIQNNLCSSSGSVAVGGGIHSGNEFEGKSFIVENNLINQNRVESTSVSQYGYGGGLFIASELYQPVVIKNTISENISSHKGGGVCCYYGTTALLSDNLISNNEAGIQGGGIEIDNSNPEILNNTITNNFTTYSGGGIGCYHSSNPEIKNNLIAYNTAGDDGGGVDFYENSNPSLINNTIVENKARWGAAMAFNSNCDPVIMNTIIFGNSADSSGNQAHFWDDDSDPTFTYCDVEGGTDDFGFYNIGDTYSGTYKNNMDNDPLFVVEDSLFHLSVNSPCIDAGNPDPAYNDPANPTNPDSALWPAMGTLLNDMGAYGGPGAIVTGLEDKNVINELIPNNFTLFQNYPNPFNPTTTISYKLQIPSFVELSIYNVLGQKLATLVSAKQPAGMYTVEWDATGFASGIYFYKIKTGKGIALTRKLIVLR